MMLLKLIYIVRNYMWTHFVFLIFIVHNSTILDGKVATDSRNQLFGRSKFDGTISFVHGR